MAENDQVALQALMRGLTTADDVHRVRTLCSVAVGPHAADTLAKIFFDEVAVAADAIPSSIRERDAALPLDWFTRPWYCMDVSCAGAPTADSSGDFETAARMLSYVHALGFRNVCLLPHYESPLGDAGYDVSDYVPRASLGGRKGFADFMNEANQLGMCICTEAVFNHTSVRHEWFRKAIGGDPRYLRYYVRRNGREKIAEEDRGGDIVCTYRDPDGTLSERIVVFPEVDRTHGLWVEVHGSVHQFYRTFHPFQVDLNLRNTEVLAELLRLLGREVVDGVLGKRADAVAHWVKSPGTASEGLPETHAIHALFKSFLRHVSPRAVFMPEVVRGMVATARYAGEEECINGSRTCSEGDALPAFEMQAALREATYLQTVAPFWARIFRTPKLPGSAVWVNFLEHHDETYLGFFPPEVRHWMQKYIASKGGRVYKNGLSAAGRYAECLNLDADCIATAIFALYMTPGAPLLYAGTEIGWGNNKEHADAEGKRMHALFKEFGIHISEGAAYDPRELQRGPVPYASFEKARKEKYAPVETVRKLNELRAQLASLRSKDVHPIDSGDIGVLCMSREAHGDEAVLCVANLTPFEKIVAMPCWQIAQRMHVRPSQGTELHFHDLLTKERFTASKDDTSFRLKLGRFEHALLVVETRSRRMRNGGRTFG